MKKRCLCFLMLLGILLPGCKLESRTPGIGICYRDRDENPLAPLLEERLTACGWDVRWSDAGNDQHKQDGQIEDLLEEGCKVMIVEPVMRTTAQSTAQQLRSRGVPGIFLGRKPNDEVLESWDRLCFVGCDSAQPGALQGEILLGTENAGDLNGDGVVSYVLLQGPADDLEAQLRCQSCIKTMGAQSRCLRRCCCDGTVSAARAACARELMQRNDPVEAVFCGSDAMVKGALEAVQNDQKRPGRDVYLVGFGTGAHTTELLRKGLLAGTVIEDIPGQVALVTQVALQLYTGAPAEKENYVNYKILTAQDLL